MPNRTVLLVHHDPDLPSFFRSGFDKTGVRFLAVRNRRGLSAKTRRVIYPVYVVEAHESCVAHLRKLDLPEGRGPWVVIAPAALLRSTFDVLRPQILQVLRLSSGSGDGTATNRAGSAPSREPFLESYIESRLHHFVRQMKAGEGRDIHALLLHEIEKPLISLTLKETGGNQIRAARLLGMNRNTLRKKIKALRIPMSPTS